MNNTMYTEYAKEADEYNLYYDQAERPSDVQLPSAVNILLLGIWLVICVIGLAIILFAKNTFLGIVVIGVPTFLGMVIKPTFALCVMMLVLPTGAGVGIPQVFTLDRGVGIALAVSFLLNLMVSQPSLHIRNKALWVLIIFTIWIFFSSLAAPYTGMELGRAFTQFQLLVLVFIVYWILQTNGEKTLRWALRSFVIGTLGTIIIAYRSGAAIISMEAEGGRYAATVGTAIDSNWLAGLISMALLAAVYLLIRDKHILWRIINLIAIISLPLMILRTGSRGGAVALVFTILSPLLFLKQVARKPALTALMLIIIIFAAGSTMLFVKSRTLEKRVETRLTDIHRAKESIAYRMRINKEAIETAAKYPAGTGWVGWFGLTGESHIPHNDFFFALGIYGIPAAALFAVFVVMMMLTVKRIPLGAEKLYARAVLTFLIVMGLDMVQLYTKHLWVFMAIIMSIEYINRFKSSTTEYLSNEIDEETADINY